MRTRSQVLTFVYLFLLASFVSTAMLAQPPSKAGKVQFRGASFPIDEEAGEVTIIVKRQGGSDGEVTVDYESSEGTATAGEDYEDVSGTLTWGNGDRSNKSFTVAILDDDMDEGQETFGITLNNATGGAQIGAVSTTTVRIKPSDRDDDGEGEGEEEEEEEEETSIIKLTAVSYPSYESNGEAMVTVERAESSAGAVSVDFSTLDGSALSDEDYTPTLTTITFADGESGLKTVSIPLIDDEEAEDLETITVVLTNATGNASLGVRDVASVLVIDDDGGEGVCVPDEETLCLRDGRFEIVGAWTDFEGNTGSFKFIPSTDSAGLAWFFSEDNVEFLLKVLNGCPLNGHFWVFYAAATNVQFTVSVTDLETGDVSTYENPLGNVPLATTDVTAFSGCS